MKIIDAQVHIWSKIVMPPTGQHRKVSQFTADELLKEMDEAGVDAALIHPPSSWDPDSNALAIEAARKYPDRFAVMGQFQLDRPENRALIHGWRNQPGMMGLRWPFFSEQQQKWLYDGSLDWLWPAVAKEGLPIAMMGGIFLPKFREIAERHPDLRMILDHCGLNRNGRDAEAFIHLDELGARQITQRRRQGHRRAALFDRALSVPQYPKRAATHFRRLRTAALLLGYRHYPDALQLSPVRDLFHRGAALAEGPGPRKRHGPRSVPMDRLGFQVLGPDRGRSFSFNDPAAAQQKGWETGSNSTLHGVVFDIFVLARCAPPKGRQRDDYSAALPQS